MSDVRHVVCQIRPATADDLGQVSDGFYVIEGQTLTMTGPDGEPVKAGEHIYQHQLREGDNPDAIARVLTKQIRQALTSATDFQRRLRYPRAGIA